MRYLPCVVCRDMMTRRNFAQVSGVILDVCRAHGVWLDHSELEKVLAFIRDGGLDRSRRLELERTSLYQRRTHRGRPPHRQRRRHPGGGHAPEDCREEGNG